MEIRKSVIKHNKSSLTPLVFTGLEDYISTQSRSYNMQEVHAECVYSSAGHDGVVKPFISKQIVILRP